MLFPQQFDFTVQYYPESCNIVADALSHRPAMEEQILVVVEDTSYSFGGPAVIQKVQEKDPVIFKVIESLEKYTCPPSPFINQMGKLFLLQAVAW